MMSNVKKTERKSLKPNFKMEEDGKSGFDTNIKSIPQGSVQHIRGINEKMLEKLVLDAPNFEN